VSQTPANASGNSSAAQLAGMFKFQVSEDKMSLFIPEGTPLNPKLAEVDFDTFRSFFKRNGIVADPAREQIEALRAFVRDHIEDPVMNSDFVLVRGSSPSAPKPGHLVWLNPKPVPKDQVVANRPFLQIMPPEPAQPGVSVMGTPVAPPMDAALPEPIQLALSEELSLTPEGMVVSQRSGQVKLVNQSMSFSEVYEVADSSLAEYHEAEFYCAVSVKGDLVGSVGWKIYGNFKVEGHLSAGNIEVHGDAQVESGVQNDGEGVFKVFGNLRTTYIQFSKVGVAKDCLVDSSIVQSEVRVGGNLLCRGEPGVVMGSEISCFGAIIANRVGSDKGRRTRIQIHRRSPNVKPARTKIAQLSKDTRMRVYGEIWTQREDAPYESPDVI
jgi:uncharacterized protein (DUF342 family)